MSKYDIMGLCCCYTDFFCGLHLLFKEREDAPIRMQISDSMGLLSVKGAQRFVGKGKFGLLLDLALIGLEMCIYLMCSPYIRKVEPISLSLFTTPPFHRI